MTKHRKDEQRKEQICQAATRCFLRRGFTATRLLDIAREAGMSKGGVYFHFRAKEDLVGEILARDARRFRARVEGYLEAGLGAEDILVHILREHLVGTMPEGGSAALAMMLVSLAPHSEACRAALAHYTAALRDVYTMVCERGIRVGRFRDGDPAEHAEVVLGVVHGVAAAAVATGRPVDGDAAMKVARRVAALLRRAPGTAPRATAGPEPADVSTVEFAR